MNNFSHSLNTVQTKSENPEPKPSGAVKMTDLMTFLDVVNRQVNSTSSHC